MLPFILACIAALIVSTIWLVFDIGRTTRLNDELLGRYGLPASEEIEQMILDREMQFAYMAELKQRYARRRLIVDAPITEHMDSPLVTT